MIRTSLTALCLLLAGGFSAAHAQDYDPRSRYSAEDARDAREAGEILPAREIQRLMRQRHPQHDVRVVDLIDARRPYYVVRVITTDGRRLDDYVDARTGRVIPERELRSYRY